jgi:ATP-dependent DNA ligase
LDTCDHVVAAIKEHYRGISVVLDGELYSHHLSDAFGKIMSAARGDSEENPSSNLQYHIYDTVADGSFAHRWEALKKDFPEDGALREVSTYEVEDDAEMRELFDTFRSEGFEGLIIRNANAPYQSRRTSDLQKVKTFDDAEFLIVGVKEGRGKLQGTLGTFTCQTSDGTVFDAKMTGNQEENGKYLTDASLWTGKMLTVQYQGLTDKNNVPRFPVGLRIREAE